jgi:hypothetical protein
MLDEEVSSLDLFGAFGTGGATILLEGERTHVVLKDNVLCNCLSLGFNKGTCPENITHILVMDGDQFCLHRSKTFAVEFCLVEEPRTVPEPSVRRAPVWPQQLS